MFKPAPQRSYSEIGQDYDLKFAWVRKEKEDYVAQHWWVKCRDFLPDALLFHKRQAFDQSIYCFKIDGKFQPQPYLALHFPGEQYKKNFLINLASINIIEQINKIKGTKIILDDKKVIVLELDPFWQKHPSLISLYTFLLKVFSYKDNDVYNGLPANEEGYYLSTKDILDKLLKNLHKLTFGRFDNEEDIHTFHNGRGFVATFKKSSTHDLKKQLDAL